MPAGGYFLLDTAKTFAVPYPPAYDYKIKTDTTTSEK
jgi:hypothetical protein